MANWKLGISIGIPDEKIFKELGEKGIWMELSMDPHDLVALDWKRLKEWIDASHVKLWSFHLPFGPLDIANPEEYTHQYAVALQAEYIKRAGELGAKIAVIHASFEPIPPEERKEWMSTAKASLAQLAEIADACGITLAVENLPRTCLGNCSADIKELLSADHRLRVCFDTNHLLDERNPDFVRELGDKIVTTHVSDYDFRDERHWMPGEGKVDWVELITALEEAGYDGPFLYEVGFEAGRTIRRRKMTVEDYRNNHRSCMEKRPIPVLGTPDPEACNAEVYYDVPKVH